MGFVNAKISNLFFGVFITVILCRMELINGAISSVIAFGDSILDTGNNNNRATTSKCNYYPYGRNFPGKIPTGRFCDGKVFSDLIAEGLGVKDTLPAFGSSNLGNEDLKTGVCFASGGSGLDATTAKIQNVITLEEQLSNFKNYLSRLEASVGKEKSKSILNNTLFLVSSGNNDIAITYYSAHLKFQTISSYTDQMVTWASNFVKEIYDLGARRIGFMGTLPLGCLPGARSTTGSTICLENVNQAAQMFNSKLANQLTNLNNNLNHADVFFIDMYNPLLNLIQNPLKSGFLVVNVGCTSTTCLTPSNYVFWDYGHPTEKSYRIIANQTLQTYAKNFS